MNARAGIRWVEASYTAIHHVLINPVYAGAYAYGKTRQETTLDAAGVRRKRIRHLPRDQWQVLIREHHGGFIDWQTYEANQARIARNTRPEPVWARASMAFLPPRQMDSRADQLTDRCLSPHRTR